VLDPNQFNLNDAWLVFQLNDAPINTEKDGSFKAVCLMDAASCFILATAMVPAQYCEPSELEVKRLFKTAWAHKRQFPSKLFVPVGQFDTTFPAQAERNGISVVTVAERELSAFTDEATQGFKEHVQQAHAQ
jgi:hypothetical protein